MSKKFQKRVESFICTNCKRQVEGDGYTDHCPSCFYSLHVDICPGDRLAECGGAMIPIGIKRKRDKYIINYRCKKCNYFFSVRQGKDDEIEKVIDIINNN